MNHKVKVHPHRTKQVFVALATLFFLIFFPFQNCQNSKIRVTSAKSHIFAEASTYLYEFIEKGRSRNIDLSSENLSVLVIPEIQIKNLLIGTSLKNSNVIGYCYFEPHFSTNGILTNFDQMVLIKEESWINMKVYQRRDLLFHELGHCLLHKKHARKVATNDITTFANQNKLSIMNPTLISLSLNEDDYLSISSQLEDELFTRSSDNTTSSSSAGLSPLSPNEIESKIKFGYSEDSGCEQF